MDIKDSYLHGTVGVVKSISVSADKLTYNLADVNNTAKTLTLPLATQSANGLLSKADKKKLDSLGTNASGNNFWEDTIPVNEAMKLTLVGYVDFTLFIRNTLSKSLSVYHISSYGKMEGNTKRISIIQIYKNNTSSVIAPVDGEASIIIKNTSSNNILYASAVILKGSFTTSLVTSDISLDIITDSNIAASNTHIKNGVITINGTSITPLTAHQSLANYVTLDTALTISGVKTFSTLLKFTVAKGTAPFLITSNTLVTNLNADLLDGYHSDSFIKVEQVSEEQNTDPYTWIKEYALTDGNLKSRVYNSHGKEWAYIINIKDTKLHGNILRTSYGTDNNPEMQLMGLWSGAWSGWRTVAFTDSNITGNAATATHASTADKLKTKRKLWGLNFDGSADVSGSLTGVTSINMNGDIVINDGVNHDRYIKWLYDNTDNFGWRIGYLGSKGGDDNDLTIDSHRKTEGWASALYFKHTTLNAHFAGIVIAPTFQGNLDGTYVNKLTGYSKATSASNIAATDTLNAALGKLEYKADTAYDWYKSVTGTDNDDIINKWEEIVGFIDSVKEGTDITDEFVTRKTNLTITGLKDFTETITSSKQLILKGTERSNIINVWNADESITTNAPTSAASIKNALQFNWYDTSWEIGNIRGSSTNTEGFGITAGNSHLCFRVTTTNCYVGSNVILHAGNSHIKNGVITINGTSITPLTTHQSLANYVTLNTALTITGLKTFESNSETTGVSLILKNKAWVGGMATAMDFYNGRSYTVPNARIATKMVGSGTAGGTLIFYTQTKHASTNPNPNDLTERLRISDEGVSTFSGYVYASRFLVENTTSPALMVVKNDNGSVSLHVDSNRGIYDHTKTAWLIGATTAGNTFLQVGNVGIGTSSPTLKLHVNGNVLATKFITSGGTSSQFLKADGSVDSNTYATTNNTFTKFSYTLPANKKVKITYSAYSLSNISVCGSNGDALLVLMGTGYGKDGTVRNTWTEVVSCSTSHFTWCIGLDATCVEISSSRVGDSTIIVLSSGNITFTEIDSLSYTAMNHTLLHSKNYTSYINTTNFPGLNKVGTVTSVAIANGGGLSVTGSPITSSGTITITNAGVRSTTINGNYLRVNTNGTNADLTIPYSTGSHRLLSTGSMSDVSLWGLPRYTSADLNTEFGTTGTDTQTYLKNYIKKIMKSHTSYSAKTGIGTLVPNSSLISLFRAYDYNNYNSTGLPLYSVGMSVDVDGKVYTWGTYNGTWNFRRLAFVSEIPTSLKNPYTLTFSAGTFASKTYDGSAAVTVNVPTKTSHLTNDSGYLTSRGYIGTTAVQASSAVQSLTGIGSISMAGDITISTNGDAGIRQLKMTGGNNDFGRVAVGATASNAGWMELATCDDGTEPIYARQYTGSYATVKNQVTLLDANGNTSFSGNILPAVNNTKTLGTSSLRWSNIYSESGNYSGDLTLYTAGSGDSPRLVFERNGLNGTSGVDWSIYDTGGNLVFLHAEGSGWVTALSLMYNTNSATLVGNMTAAGFVKSGSSDSYVLLGGGGHKTISSLSVASANTLNATTVVSAKAFSLSNASWTDTGYTFASLASGTYAVQVTSGSNLVASGIMSVYKNLSDTAGDEIPLHVYGTAGWRPYLRTYANKLLISSNDASATSRTVTIKIALIL